VEPDVVGRAAETGDEDDEDRGLIDGEDGERRRRDRPPARDADASARSTLTNVGPQGLDALLPH